MTVADTIAVRGGILVAHDGSAHGAAALRAALRCAPVFDHRVHVVRAWTIATAPQPPGFTGGYVPGIDEFEAATLAALDELVAPVRAEHGDVEITTSVVHGSASKKLIEASGQVDLVVIGSRGRGGFAGLTLGSTSLQVVQHASCAVLVDRGADDAAQEPAEDALEQALASELGLLD